MALVVVFCMVAPFAVAPLLPKLIGWDRLSRQFPPPRTLTPQPDAKRTNGRIGMFNIGTCLYVSCTSQGLHLSMMSPFSLVFKPMLIPWAEIHNEKVLGILGFKSTEFEIGAPPIKKIQLTGDFLSAPTWKKAPSDFTFL